MSNPAFLPNREERRRVALQERQGIEDLPNVRPVMVTRQQLPKYFPGMAVRTWANMAHLKEGPRVYRKGKLAWYVVDEVVNYLTQNPIETTGGTL